MYIYIYTHTVYTYMQTGRQDRAIYARYDRIYPEDAVVLESLAYFHAVDRGADAGAGDSDVLEDVGRC